MQALQAPQAEEAKCLGCRAEAGLGVVGRLVRDLRVAWEEQVTEARKLRRENGDLLDQLYDREQRIQMLEDRVNALRPLAERAVREGVVVA